MKIFCLHLKETKRELILLYIFSNECSKEREVKLASHFYYVFALRCVYSASTQARQAANNDIFDFCPKSVLPGICKQPESPRSWPPSSRHHWTNAALHFVCFCRQFSGLGWVSATRGSSQHPLHTSGAIVLLLASEPSQPHSSKS